MSIRCKHVYLLLDRRDHGEHMLPVAARLLIEEEKHSIDTVVKPALTHIIPCPCLSPPIATIKHLERTRTESG